MRRLPRADDHRPLTATSTDRGPIPPDGRVHFQQDNDFHYFPEKNIGIRIEDTVLVTRDGCEVLTRGVPKEIDEIEALMAAVKR